jgi:hypothetical protein
MRPTFKLPITVEARPSEMTGPFLARIAEANVLSPKQLYDLLCALAKTTGSRPKDVRDRDALARVLTALGDPHLAEEPVRASDFTLRDWSGRSFKQVCPVCLEEDRAITHGLAEKSWAMCLHHRLGHLTHCPHCRERLNWSNGSYFHCACGYDLRLGPRVPVSPNLAQLLEAVAENRAPTTAAIPLAMEAQNIWLVKSRLASTLAYLADGLNIPARPIGRDSETSVSPFLECWEEIAKVVESLRGIREAACAIETRLALAGLTRSSIQLTKGHMRRAQLTWKHLADCAVAALSSGPLVHRGALYPSMRKGRRLSSEARKAIGGVSCPALSNALRSALEREIADAWKSPGVSTELVKERIDSIAVLANDLRQLSDPHWLRADFVDVAEVLSLIGCGVLAPWGRSYVRNWHVRATDLARVAGDFKILPGGREILKPSVGYVLHHSVIFSGRTSVREWLQLSKKEVTERVRCLLPDWRAAVQARGPAPGKADSQMPFAFGYFLAHRWVARFAIEAPAAIQNCYLVASEEDVLQEALVKAWENARTQVDGLQGWTLDCARASQHVLHECAPTGNPVLGTRAAESSTTFGTQVGHERFASVLDESLRRGAAAPVLRVTRA